MPPAGALERYSTALLRTGVARPRNHETPPERGFSGTGAQVKRLLGPARLERDGVGWKGRRGRVPVGALDQRAATIAMREVIRAQETTLGRPRTDRAATFADAAAAWLHHMEHVEG